MKKCGRCKKDKDYKEFYKLKSGKNKGLHTSYCKACNLEYRKEYLKIRPWAITYTYIKNRMHDKTSDSYKRYSKRKMSLGMKELKHLWFRDRAYRLKQPSIDRIDNDKDYTLDNCRYIEKVENSRLGGLIGSKRAGVGRPKKGVLK